jgi:hypothetical protein
MAVKSVIEIDVQDEKFKAFQATFDKYIKQMDQQSKKWQEINKHFDKVNKSAKDVSGTFKDLSLTTSNIARNMASMAISAAKWIAFSAGTTGFGFGALAASGSDVYRRAQGVGVSTAQLRAANVYYSKFIDAESALANIARIQRTPEESWKLFNSGGNLGKNAFENLAPVLKNIREAFIKSGQNLPYAKTMGWTDIVGGEDNLIRLAATDLKRLDQAAIDASKNLDKLKVSEENSQRWQDFWQKIREAGNAIESSLLNNLEGLTQPLIQLTEAIEQAIADFLKSDDLKKAIENFTKFIGSEEGKQDIKDFFKGLAMLGQAIAWVVSKIPGFVSGTYEGMQQIGAWEHKVLGKDQVQLNSAAQKTAMMLAGLGIKPDVVAGFMGGLYGESGFNPAASNSIGGGHVGLAQWGVSRQKDFARVMGHPLTASTPEDEQIAFMRWEMLNTETATLKQLQSGVSKREGVEANINYERYYNYQIDPVERSRRQNYAMQITFEGAPGTSIPNATAQLAGTTGR